MSEIRVNKVIDEAGTGAVGLTQGAQLSLVERQSVGLVVLTSDGNTVLLRRNTNIRR